MWQNEIFPAGGPTARDGAVLKAWRAVMSMLTAPLRAGKFVKTTPCTVEATGSARSARPITCGSALPISLYHIINLTTRREETHAETEAAQYRRCRRHRHPHPCRGALRLPSRRWL